MGPARVQGFRLEAVLAAFRAGGWGWGWPKAVTGPAEQETESASTQALCHWLRQLGI